MTELEMKKLEWYHRLHGVTSTMARNWNSIPLSEIVEELKSILEDMNETLTASEGK